MRRRSRYDSLQPLDQPTWLVVRNVHSQAMDSRQVAAGANLRAVLTCARNERIAQGWGCQEIGRSCPVIFIERNGVRLQIGIERHDPEGPPAPGHSDACV